MGTADTFKWCQHHFQERGGRGSSGLLCRPDLTFTLGGTRAPGDRDRGSLSLSRASVDTIPEEQDRAPVVPEQCSKSCGKMWMMCSDPGCVGSVLGTGDRQLCGQGHGKEHEDAEACLQQRLDTDRPQAAVMVSGALVPTSEVGRLCCPEMGHPSTHIDSPHKEFPTQLH